MTQEMKAHGVATRVGKFTKAADNDIVAMVCH